MAFLACQLYLNFKIFFKKNGDITSNNSLANSCEIWCFAMLILSKICLQIKFVFLYLFNFFVITLFALLGCVGTFLNTVE